MSQEKITCSESLPSRSTSSPNGSFILDWLLVRPSKLMLLKCTEVLRQCTAFASMICLKYSIQAFVPGNKASSTCLLNNPSWVLSLRSFH